MTPEHKQEWFLAGGFTLGMATVLVTVMYWYIPMRDAQQAEAVKAAREAVLREAVLMGKAQWSADKEGYPTFRWAQCPVLGGIIKKEKGR